MSQGREALPAAPELGARLEQARRENERLLREVAAVERRFRSLVQRVWRAQEEERRRLARELHDGVGQTLTALKNQLERTRRTANLPAAVRSALAGAVEESNRALEETRELSRRLRPAVLDDLGLVAALHWLARRLRERAGLRVETELDGFEGVRVAPDLETLLFRIAQEGLTNVLKHAGVDRARLRLRASGGRVLLGVEDDGRGLPADATAAVAAGFGVRAMRERVQAWGGRLVLRSAPGAGTSIEVDLPADIQGGGADDSGGP
jgi:two-component system sensor histidine kinase UhpB